jgi:signal transduction histidine kinase
VTVQNLASIKANLTRTREASLEPETEAQEPLEEAASLCDQVIKELRTLSYLLHPPLLDEIGLVAALQWYVRGFIQRCGIEVEVLIMQDIGRLSPDAEVALFRVVQESLTNIHHHSGSQTAIIWVTMEEGEVVLQIKDEGRGMVGESPHDGRVMVQSLGVGILGMRQRLEQLGGRLEIESDGQGTTVKAIVPISKEELCPAY